MKASASFLTRFCRETRGNVMILFGLLFFIVVAASGMGVDLGRQQLLRIKLQQASDAAALAGALADNSTDRAATALRYFKLNFPTEYMGVARPSPTISVGTSVNVAASVNLNTIFVRFIGNTSTVSAGSSTVAIDNKTTGSIYDMVLVMDNSHSMYEEDVGTSNSLEVPDNIIYAARLQAFNQCFYVEHFSGCYLPTVAADGFYGLTGYTRINALRYAANILITQLLGKDGNDNRVAGVSWDSTLIGAFDLTNNLKTATAFINIMGAIGNTNSTVGLQTAKNIAANFRPKVVRAVVLITDGENNSNNANTTSNAVCSSLKNDGILIYTIAFGPDVNSNASVRNFLSGCASGIAGKNEDEYFFIAPSGAELQGAFSAILTSINKVKIIQ